MKTATASDFRRNFSRYRQDAGREPVAVSNRGEIIGYFVSIAEFEHYQKLRRREREVFRVGELPDDIIAAIEAAEYPPGYEHLDALYPDEDEK